jgi:hypothetical protein
LGGRYLYCEGDVPLLFTENFHGDNGAGLGGSHQTGWTGTVATLIDLFGRLDAHQYLDIGKAGTFANDERRMTGPAAAD